VGQSGRNDFEIPSPEIPMSYRFIQKKGNDLYLEFEKGMYGKVLLGGEVLDLKAVAQKGLAQRTENHFSAKLDFNARGKILIGDVTVLFQFVEPPPEVPRLTLPASAKGAWWRNIDRPFLGIMLLSFLLQAGTEGYQEYYWRTTGKFLVKEEKDVPKILQALVKMEKREEPVEEVKADESAVKEQKEELQDKTKGELAEKAAELNEGKEENLEVAKDSEGTGLEVGDMEDMDSGMGDMKDDMKGRFEDMGQKPERGLSAEERLARADQMVSNRTVAGVLGSAFGAGESGMDVLSAGARGSGDAGWGEGDITVGDGEFGGPKSDLFDDSGVGGLVDGGGMGGGEGVPNIAANLDIDVKANAGPSSAEAISGPKKKLEVVKVQAKEEEKIKVKVRGGEVMGLVGGKIDKAALEKYIRQRTVAVQRCYLDAVRRNPSAGGRLVLQLTISTNGRASVEVVSDEVGDPSVGKCVMSRIRSWRFPSPEGKSVQLKLPFVFRSI
jgi:hypothetical protein